MQLTTKEQTARVAFLGFTFMIIFTAFNSLQNMVAKLYEEYHYTNLGRTAVLVIYLTFALCTFFTSFVIKNFGYKKVMLVASLGYAVFEMTGLLIASELGLSEAAAWTLVLSGAALCGASASVIWVAQGAYTSQVAGEKRKSELFGLFWALMMSSQIFGNLLTTFVLGTMSNFTYFLILTILGSSSAFLFLWLPSVSKVKQETQNVTIKEEFLNVLSLIKNTRYLKVHIYYLFPGLTIGFYTSFLYKLIVFSVKQDDGETDNDFQHRLNFSEGLVFISLGLSQLLTGILMNRFSQPFCKFKLAVVGTVLVEVAGFTSFICYFLESYPLCFVSAFLWGASETFLQTNTNALIGMLFPNKVQAYSVYRIVFSVGVVLTILFSILLTDSPPYIFLSIVLLVQVLASAISLGMDTLKGESGTTSSNSLLTKQDEINE